MSNIFKLLNKANLNSIHLKQFPKYPSKWKNEKLNSNWSKLMSIRDNVNISIESKR